MTCIAYRDGVLAADSACWGSDGSVIVGHFDKIARLKSGALVAVTGAPSMTVQFREWLERGSPKDQRLAQAERDGFAAIVVHPGGKVVRYDRDWLPYEMKAPYHAVGRGSPFMLGAMAAGAGAVQAVELAPQHTDGGAGKVLFDQIELSPKFCHEHRHIEARMTDRGMVYTS